MKAKAPRISRRRCVLPFKTLKAAAAFAILSGPIYSQVIPSAPTTRSWDNGGAGTGAGTFNWGDAVNWSADILPGVDDIASLSLNITGVQNIDLGGVSREIGVLYFSVNSSSNYTLSNGTIVTNFINQNQDDPNALTSSAQLSSKNNGADIIDVSVSSNTLQLQGKITSGGLNKFNGGTLRLGTSGTAFNNAIDGDITIYGGTLRASAGATAGVNNPLAGSGDIVIGAPGVTLQLEAQVASGEYDFVRNIRAGNNDFTITNNNASGTDPGDPTMRIGTLSIGNATLTSNGNSGYRTAFDGLNLAAGSTNTRIQVNSLTFIDGLTGGANTAIYKRGGTDLEIRGNNEASFAGNIYIKESTLRLLSTTAGENPAGGSDSTIYFAHGYGLTGLDGGQTLQLRSDTNLDFGSNFAFGPGVKLGRIDVNRVGTSATTQTLSLGVGNISGGQLNVVGGNSYILELDGLTVDAGTSSVLNASSANTRVGVLSIGAGATLTKIGGSQLVLTGDNTSTLLGTLDFRQGELQALVAGSLGNRPITLGGTAPNSVGILAETAMLRWNAVGATGNTSGPDVTVNAGSQIDLNVVPDVTDVFSLKSGGIIQGNASQFAALTVGSNLLIQPEAILGHETFDLTSQITGLANDASLFYGISATATSILPAIGVGTPWKGFSNDRSARTVAGSSGSLVPITINGGDGDVNTIEAIFQGVNGQTLSFGSSTTNDSYNFISATGQKVTLAIRGLGGTSLVLTPGGNVALEDAAASTGLSANVDKILVQSGTLLLGANGALGGVPVDVLNGGGLDIRTAAALDGPVNIKSGGVLWLNDNFQITGSGTITIEGGGKLDMSGNAPANLLTSSQAIQFTGTGHTVRFAPSEITNLDSTVPNAGVTYVVAGGAATAIIPGTNVNVTTNTQSAGITIENGILTNDGTSRGFAGPITLNNTNLTVAATRGTTLAVVNGISTTGAIQIGSDTAIDFRDKTPNPDRLSGLGLPNPYDGSPQVVFVGPFTAGGNVTVTGTHLAFADATTKIGGDLIFNGNALYLDGGGPLSGGSSTKGDLTARLTDTTGLVENRIAKTIIMGNYTRSEMSISVGSGTQTITQPFVITGKVNPVDKRTFWVDRAEASGTVNALFTDILLKPGAEFGIDESNVGVRASLKLDGNATLVRNHDDYDLRDLVKGPNAPANLTLLMGEPAFGWVDATETLVNGSNATLNTSIDGTIGSGITLDVIRSTVAFEQNAVLNGVIRAQTAPDRGDSLIISRSSGLTTDTTFTGTGEIQIGRSIAANGPEDFEMRATEGAAGSAPQVHTVAVPVRVVNDGQTNNIDGVIRSERHNDSTVNGQTVLNTLNVDAGATVQTISSNQTRLTINQVNLGANSGIDSTNATSVFLGNVAGGANPIRFTGSALAQVTGNVTASQINVNGAGIKFDPGIGNVSNANAPVSLSGMLQVSSGTADLGTNLITGAATQTVAGLRENKTQGSFDEATANTSNEVKLGPVLAQVAANIGWGENQTVTYTGQIFIPDNGAAGDGVGSVAFAKWFDDSAKITIDGTTYLRHTTYNDGVSTGAITLSSGWHDIEIRLGQGTGGAGPVGQDGNVSNLGLGIDLTDPVSDITGSGVGVILNGVPYVSPLDNGSMNLFRTTTVKSTVNVGGDATLKAGGFTNLGDLRFTGFNATANIAASGAAQASTTDTITVTGSATGTLNVARAQDTITAGQMNLDSSLTKAGEGTLIVSGGSSAGFGDVFVQAGRFIINGIMSGSVTADPNTTVGGSGTVGALTATNSTISPGNLTAGILHTGSLTITGGTLSLELNGPGVGQSDQLNVAGAVTLFGDTNITLSLGYIPAIGQAFTIINNDDVDPVNLGSFRFVYNNKKLNEGDLFTTPGGVQFRLSYIGGTGNDVVLTTTIPEPGTAVSLVGGLGALLGLRRFRRRK